MKRTIALLLAAVLSLGLFGCQKDSSKQEAAMPEITAFSVGYAKMDVTPDFSVPLNGYGNIATRMSTGFLDRVYATCIAITDANNETVLIFTYDMASADPEFLSLLRASVSQKTGIPGENIMLTASHSHSAPAVGSSMVEIQSKYDRKLAVWMVDVALEALADRKEAQMYIGSVDIEGQNFVRHYQLDDGSAVGYSSMVSNNAVAHQGIGDTEMQLLKFTRQGGKDILIANWQCHPHRTGGSSKYDISADIVGVMRTQLEAELDCNFAYIQGAAGNMNPTSLLATEKVAESYQEQGRQIAQFVLDAGDSAFTQVETGDVKLLRTDLEVKVDHSEDYLYASALQVKAVWEQTNDRAKAEEIGKPLGIRSPYHAGRIVANQKLGQSDIMELNVIGIGDVAFVTAGYEMFAANGLFIKNNSPYKMTVIMGYANDNNTYIPSIDSFEYEAYENDQTRYEPGTGEMLAQTLLQMLNEMKQESAQ